jgi:hypothetical protein
MSPAARRLAGAARALAPLGLAALTPLAVFSLVLACLRGPSPFNSDNLLCSALCEDALRGADLSGWNFPGAPYLFPDALLLLPCHALCPGLPASFLAYGALFYGSTLACLYWLARQVGAGRRGAFVSASAGLTLLQAAHLRGGYRGVGQLLGHPGNHAGAVLVGLLLTALTARALRRGGHGRLCAAAFVLCGGLGALSDKLVLAQFVLPGCLALAALALWRRAGLGPLLRHALLVGAALLLAEGLKLLLARLGLRIERAEQDMHWPRPDDLLALLKTLWQLVKGQHLLLAFLSLNLAAALLVLTARRAKAGPAAEPSGGAAASFTALAAVLSPLCNVLVVFAVGMSRHPAVSRYILAVCVLPFLFPALLLALLPWRAARLGRGLLVAFVIGLALHQCRLLLPAVSREALRQPYPPLAQAIDRLVEERGPMRGLAGYWTARHLSFLTHSRTPVLPILLNGMPFPHGSNALAFLSPRPGEAPLPEYHFVVITPGGSLSPPAEVVATQFGEPARKVQAGPDEIWVYDRLESSLFARYLCALAAPRLRQEGPFVAHERPESPLFALETPRRRERPFVAPIRPRELARPKANGTPPESRGVVALGSGQALDVWFPRPVAARVLDVAADPTDRLRLRFYRGAEPVGTVTVPPVPWTAGLPHWSGGLQARLVAVPPEARARPWDHVVVMPAGPVPVCRVGHLLAYERDVPCLPAFSPSVRLPRCFPAEGLPSEAPPDSLVADPAASRGRARCSPAGFAGFLSAGPAVSLPPGRYQVEFTLAADGNGSAEPAAVLDVVCGADGTALAARTLHGADFAAGGRYSAHRLTFTLAEERELLDFRVRVCGQARVRLDRIDLTHGPD